MSNPVQIELGAIAGLKEEADKIIRKYADDPTRIAFEKYNEIVGQYIYSLACIVSQHENKISALEHKLEHR